MSRLQRCKSPDGWLPGASRPRLTRAAATRADGDRRVAEDGVALRAALRVSAVRRGHDSGTERDGDAPIVLQLGGRLGARAVRRPWAVRHSSAEAGQSVVDGRRYVGGRLVHPAAVGPRCTGRKALPFGAACTSGLVPATGGRTRCDDAGRAGTAWTGAAGPCCARLHRRVAGCVMVELVPVHG